MTHPAKTSFTALLAALLGLLLFSAPASASKQVVDFFGGQGTIGGQFLDAAGVAVNYSGAGGVPVGTFYVTDGGGFSSGDARGNRVQRFERDDSGTPADASDDTYHFVAAWGAGVQSGGTDYEICTVAADCRSAAGIGGNGALAGDGALSKPSGIAVDQDTGQVYVADNSSRRTPDGNFRISVYSASGAFLRSFGFDVVASGPDDNGTGYEVCKAGLDICKAGLRGAGLGQIGAQSNGEGTAESIAASPPDGNPASGAVFLADPFNRRINTYNLDGSSPSSIGSAATFDPYQPGPIAIDSRGILYAATSKNNYEIERYDTLNANGSGVGFLAPIAAGKDEVQKVTIAASAGSFRLSFGADTTADLPFNLKPKDDLGSSNTPGVIDSVQEALETLPSIGANNVRVEGGPGDAAGSAPYTVTFTRALSAKDVSQLVASGGATPLSGGAGASVTTTTPGQNGLASGGTNGLAVDPDTDGAGPDTDVLYVLRGNIVQQFGPVNQPGLTAPPTAVDDTHGSIYSYNGPHGIAVEPPTGRLYVAVSYGEEGNPFARGVLVLDTAGGTPTASLDSVTPTATTATVHATVNPNGRPLVSYRLEYVTQADFAAGGWAKARSTASAPVGTQETPQPLTALLDPPGAGLDPVTLYHVRLVATKVFNPPVITNEATFTTLPAPPRVETTGAPIRTATTAQLSGRVNPRGSATDFHFEYVTDAAFQATGFADLSSGGSTTPRPAGSGQLIRLVSEQVSGLDPDTTYRYRILAGNGNGSPVAGSEMTVTTGATDAPLHHGSFPGPPGSDRAWEMVSAPETSGNPVFFGIGFSDDGRRAFYQVTGGVPGSSTGTLTSFLYSERPPGAHPTSGWQSSSVDPPRSELPGGIWADPAVSEDASAMVAWSRSSTGDTPFRLSPTGHLQLAPEFLYNPGYTASADLSTVVVRSERSFDPAHAPGSGRQLYDVADGTPSLVSFLPDGSVGPCESSISGGGVSAEGSLVFFYCGSGLYLRDLSAGTTALIATQAGFTKSTPGAAFFTTAQSLDPADGGGNDVYRYDLQSGERDCLTCVVAGLDAEVPVSGGVAIADDGSRVYFKAANRLLPGAPPNAIYRVSVATGALAYVADLGAADGSGADKIGEDHNYAQAISADGTRLFFGSSDPGLNPVGGQDNGGTFQYYLYDDRDRSLTCVSCPPDGSEPLVAVKLNAAFAAGGTHKNATTLADDGTVAFATTTPLLPADQNTPGPGNDLEAGGDIYEYRDGRLFLVTDGATSWPVSAPDVAGITASGDDLFFLASARYTADALDAQYRLYDARIGGGIDFPPPPVPCPLEVCQGTPKGAPDDPQPGTTNFTGPGNPVPVFAHKCRNGRVRRKGRCVAKHHKRAHTRAANHNRRATR